jgi:hypothetical protein
MWLLAIGVVRRRQRLEVAVAVIPAALEVRGTLRPVTVLVDFWQLVLPPSCVGWHAIRRMLVAKMIRLNDSTVGVVEWHSRLGRSCT